jgi:ketosteroid isomerase-like protein
LTEPRDFQNVIGPVSGVGSNESLMDSLPSPVAAFVNATNVGNLQALLATFVDDALVNDQLRDYWGKDAITKWAEQDIVGEGITMDVTGVVIHYSHAIVTAHIDGNFD